jgi:hypothetical protein
MTLCIVTGSTDREWVRAISGLRRRGVGAVVVLVDRFSFARSPATEGSAGAAADAKVGESPEADGGDTDSHPADAEGRAEVAACRHALAEYDIVTHVVHAGDDLSAVLGERSRARA